jgi:t-SNARE complex subunit (syntaxin)
MREIAELMNVFTTKVAQQQEDVQSIETSTADANENIERGLDELIKSSKASRFFRQTYATFVVAMALVLLLLDAVHQ